MNRIRSAGVLALATIGLGIAACADSTGPDGDARIRVQLTDAPSEADEAQLAELHIRVKKPPAPTG